MYSSLCEILPLLPEFVLSRTVELHSQVCGLKPLAADTLASRRRKGRRAAVVDHIGRT